MRGIPIAGSHPESIKLGIQIEAKMISEPQMYLRRAVISDLLVVDETEVLRGRLVDLVNGIDPKSPE